MSMWQRFLDRYVPVLHDLPSTLDRADGVGRSLVDPVQPAESSNPVPAMVRALSAF